MIVRDTYSCDGCGLPAPELVKEVVDEDLCDLCGGCAGLACQWCDAPLERGDGLTCSACLEMDDDRAMLALTRPRNS